MLYGMYEPEAQTLLFQITDGRYGSTELGYVQTEAQEDSGEEPVEGAQEEGAVTELPGFYDCRISGKAPTVKDQGEFGTCWAVAASSILESRLLPEESIVFSADHISAQNGFSGSTGGAFMMSAAYLTAWVGPVTEEQDPYGDGISAEDAQAVKHVQEIQMVNDRDFNEIKRLVYTYGAVQSSIYMDMGSENGDSPYYQKESASYCYTGDAEVNHDLLIIGWDDAYPAENFSCMPERDGAFICQNSWGTSFGEGGVFYVSYEDTRIGTGCAVCTRVEPADNYDHIYQSDLCGFVGQMGYEKESCQFANVYTAESDEVLRAVGFYAVDKHTTYEIQVVEDFQNVFSLVLAKTVQEGTFENPGFYTVDLEKEVQIPKGQKFAVVVKIKTPGEEYPVAMEYRADAATQRVILDDGEGYISPDGYRWTEVEETYGGNVCLKAYTDEVQ